MRGRGRGFGEKGRGGGWANWAQGGAPGAAGPAGVGPRRGREREKEERERERRKKERKDLLLIFEIRSFYMNAFALSKQSKEMQGRHGASNNIKYLGFLYIREFQTESR